MSPSLSISERLLQGHNRVLLLRIRDSEEKICLQQKELAVEHRVKQQNCDLSHDKPVAEAAYGLNACFVSGLCQQLAQALHIDVDRALINVRIARPNLRE
jgi:hypothetical protein